MILASSNMLSYITPYIMFECLVCYECLDRGALTDDHCFILNFNIGSLVARCCDLSDVGITISRTVEYCLSEGSCGGFIP